MWLHCSDVYRRVETDVRSVAAETPEENALVTGLSIAPGDACGRLNVQSGSGTNEVTILATSQQSYSTRYDVYYVKYFKDKYQKIDAWWRYAVCLPGISCR